ncbi:GAF domain-containing protein [Leptolyngbya ohadii]|uniref:GAF domain-containing protein n=1 Tax=Leptolyngbya ohadii TaxID=1962290 RepID=UPI0019D4E871|nr:GAF domain-containing protein [Leptolyngbya ohadii]
MEKTPEGRSVHASPIKRLMNRLLSDVPDAGTPDEQWDASSSSLSPHAALAVTPPSSASAIDAADRTSAAPAPAFYQPAPHAQTDGVAQINGMAQLDGVTQEPANFMQKIENSQGQSFPYGAVPRSYSSSASAASKLDQRLEWLFQVASRMQQAETRDALLTIAVAEIRQHFSADRVLVYQAQGERQGIVVAESMINGFTPSLNETLSVVLFGDETLANYQNQPFVTVNAASEQVTPYQSQLLDRFQIKTSLSLPIVIDQQIWGLLAVQQCARLRQWELPEINLLQQIVQELRLNFQPAEARAQKQEQAEQDKIVAQVIHKIHQASDVDSLFNTTTQEVRHQLKCDRVAVYRFDADWGGRFVSESVGRNWVGLVGRDLETAWNDTHLQETQGGRYRHHETFTVDDIYEAGLAPCHIEILEGFEAKAQAIAPIFDGEKLWGLLAAYQNSGARHWTASDVNLLVQVGRQFGLAIHQAEYLEQLRDQSKQLTKTAERERVISKTVDRIRQSLDLQTMLKTTAREVRSFLQVDRVAIFKLFPGYAEGETIAEDVKAGLVSAMSVKVIDHCFSEGFAEQYRQGRVFATSDIYESGLQECYLETLSHFQVRANLVVPLLRGEDLWGLFCIHHCTEPRVWKEGDIEFAKQIAAQLNVAIQQGEFIEQLQQQSRQVSEAADREKVAKEQLQQEVMQLLTAVRPALAGDLTVRAPVTDSEVGTIADAYNNTLNSLRQTVTQMQTAANQVAQTSQANNTAINQLALQAQHQLQALEQVFAQVQAMAVSTQNVEADAQQVEAAVQQANQIVMAGDAAIDRTVDEMEDIRATVIETSIRLRRLSESSQKISRVVSLIGQFTTQTQLLALNATIEATRAGDFGRGFAVVADEVRSLARQSASAATEIEQLVQEIQASTAEVATAMETGIEQVSSGTTVVIEAREYLNAIVNATAQISQLVAGITQATQAQAQQSQSVTQTMQDVAAIANRTSQDAGTISASFQDLLAMAQDLQSKSEQFKAE